MRLEGEIGNLRLAGNKNGVCLLGFVYSPRLFYWWYLYREISPSRSGCTA
jgi:hypothetical protein